MNKWTALWCIIDCVDDLSKEQTTAYQARESPMQVSFKHRPYRSSHLHAALRCAVQIFAQHPMAFEVRALALFINVNCIKVAVTVCDGFQFHTCNILRRTST